MVLSLFSGALLFTTILGGSARVLRVHESRYSAPRGFVAAGPASPDSVIDLRVALVRNNVDGLIEALYDVSTPSSTKYGQFLNQEEVEAFVRPNEDSVTAVNEWLGEHGLTATSASPAGDWLSVQVPISAANDLLAANYTTFTHSVTGKQAVRTLTYSIPSDLVEHIDLIHPTISFPNPRGHSPIVQGRPASSSELTGQASDCSDANEVNPVCLQKWYNIPSTSATGATNGIAVTGYEGEYANFKDLTQFLQSYRTDMDSATNFSFVSLENGTNSQDQGSAGYEASLDIQYTVGIATGVPITFYSDGNWTFDDALLNTATYLLNLTDPPQVVTTSYGDDEEYVSPNLAANLCDTYAQLGARGVSILFASGDGGVSGLHYQQCTTFVPTFPSGCPYVTSVGGTTNFPETATNISGGGFSNLFPAPAYQSSAISAYLERLGSNNTGLYNTTGRGFPDVAAYAENFDVVVAGVAQKIGGTSAATPTFASVIALLNDELIQAGKAPLGFLNPWLYSAAADALNDITLGDNRACENNTGFDATPGWDPVTGLGSPNYTKLRTAAGL